MQMTHGSDFIDNGNINKKIQQMMPTQIQDIIATSILLVFLPCGLVYQFFFILPNWYPVMGEAWVIRTACITFAAFNLYSNWLFMIKIGPSGKNSVLPNVVKPGYRFCHSCHAHSPPRAYHCPVCDVCVLRRDHHCSFGGVCVGHFNQRYFVAAVLNLLLMTAPCVGYSWNLLDTKLNEPISLGNIWQLMLPHLAWIFGFITFFQFLHVISFILTFTVFFFGIYLLAAQLMCIYRGQTRVEFLLDVHAYQLGFFENLRHSLGTRWPLIMISCFIPSPLPSSDGLSFATRDMFNAHTKNL